MTDLCKKFDIKQSPKINTQTKYNKKNHDDAMKHCAIRFLKQCPTKEL
jgi:hypothetical protein